MDHELETLEQYIEEARLRFDGRRRLRETNCQSDIDYSSIESELNNLDSSIKKNSALVKRLKVFTESQKEQVLSEIDRLNLIKFISEVVSSIIEAKLKLSDIPAVIEICTRLNRTYREFSKQLLEQFVRYFPAIKQRKNHDPLNALVHQPGFNPVSQNHATTSSSFTNLSSLTSSLVASNSSSGSNNVSSSITKSQIKNNIAHEGHPFNPSKIRVDLRLFAELVISGIFPLKDGFPVLMNLLCYLLVNDKNNHQNANAILTFCKGCGDEFLGIVPKPIQLLASKFDRVLPKGDLISPKKQEILRTYFCDYYQSLLKHLHLLHDELNELVARNKRLYKSKGEISKDTKDLVDIKHSECQKFQNILNQLADLLGEVPKDLPDFDSLKEETKDEVGAIESLSLDTCSTGNRNGFVWDDEGTRSFYEDLLDLRTLFPNLVVKVSSGRKKVDSAAQAAAKDDTDQTFGTVGKKTNDSSSVIADTNTSTSGGNESLDLTTPTKSGEDDLEKPISSSSSEESLNSGETNSPQSLPFVMSQAVANRAQPDQYFSKLSNSVNRDMIDNAAIDFIRFFNTKFGRRKLVKTLFNVQRTRLDLLPFFARLTATIHRFVPSIGNDLVSSLKQDFRNLFRKKDQINIESKVKNVRFIGELVKFNLYSKQEALNCLKMLLSDFTHHHIEMTCNLLETCGRLLYKSSESHHQLRSLLEQMMRKKLLLSVDSKYVTMIENAYYFTNPPEIVRHVVEEPPVHIYVRYLLCECLNRSSIDKVLQKIKKLDWNDKALAKFVINCMIEAYNLKFYNIRYLAALLAALNKEHQWISVAVIDGVVEDILLMMEIDELYFNQRRIPMVRYFGELYNYRLSDSSLVFKILYSLITYGVYYPEPDRTLNQIPMSQLDSPDNLFRIKLVCDLLETCGQYLSSGQEKKKLDCYLLFFQRYYWCKKHIYMLHPYCMAKSGNHFPASIEYLYNDAIFNLRPTFQMATSYAQAIQSMQNFIDTLIDRPPPPIVQATSTS